MGKGADDPLDDKIKAINIIKTLSEKKTLLLLDFIDQLEKANT